MISISDVNSLSIYAMCEQSFPCSHHASVTLNDGRKVTQISNSDICCIIESLADEKIHVRDSGTLELLKVHLRMQRVLEKGGDESVESVLTRIFQNVAAS
jgi:hypothetical protein